MANADPLHQQFMALTNVAGLLSEKDRIQLINTLVFLVRNEHPSITNIRDVNLVTLKNTSDTYRSDITFRNRTIIFGRDVKTRLDALGGLRDAIEKRAAQVLLDTTGPRNGRVLASDRKGSDNKIMQAPEGPKDKRGKFLTRNADGDVARLDANIVQGDKDGEALRPVYADLKRKASEQEDNSKKKSRVDDDFADSPNPGDIEEGEISEHGDKQEKTTQHDTKSELDKLEGDGSPPSISTVLAKYAAGELKGRKWRGRIADAATPKTWNMDGIAEGNVSDDEQRIIGEDDEFWRNR